METSRHRRRDPEPVKHAGDIPAAITMAEAISDAFGTIAFQPPHDEIARRAYELYEQRGGEHGHDCDDWLQAERELRQLTVHQVLDTMSWTEGASATG